MRRYYRAALRLCAVALGMSFLSLATPASADPCTGSSCLGAGEKNETISVGSSSRKYIVHVPQSYRNDTAVPLVLDLHGFTSSNSQQRLLSGQLINSELRNFIVVWPQGEGNSWNAYGCCGTSILFNVDDVGFLRALVANIKTRANIDPTRVYITGLSNGGSMSHRAACEASDVFAAAAPVSFTLNRATALCRPARTIPVVEFHGTLDILVGYGGGLFQGAVASRDAWGQISGCTGSPVSTTLSSSATSTIYTNCRDGVKTGLVTVNNGQHILYGNGGVDIAKYIWDNVFVK